MPAALRVRFLRTACPACWLLDVSRPISSRMVFRAQGESPAPRSKQMRAARKRESCNASAAKPINLGNDKYTNVDAEPASDSDAGPGADADAGPGGDHQLGNKTGFSAPHPAVAMPGASAQAPLVEPWPSSKMSFSAHSLRARDHQFFVGWRPKQVAIFGPHPSRHARTPSRRPAAKRV